MEPERKCLHKMLKLPRKDEIAQGNTSLNISGKSATPTLYISVSPEC